MSRKPLWVSHACLIRIIVQIIPVDGVAKHMCVHKSHVLGAARALVSAAYLFLHHYHWPSIFLDRLRVCHPPKVPALLG